MMTAWERVHARYRLVDRVLQRIARSGRGTDAERWRAEIEEVFGDFGAFLLHLQRRWYTALETRLDAALEHHGDHDLPALVAQAWREMTAADGAARMVLDAYADDPDVRKGEARQRRILGAGTGAFLAEPACA